MKIKVVQTMSETTPPGGESEGDIYIPAEGSDGAWSGHDGQYAIFIQGAYRFSDPVVGDLVQVLDVGHLLQYDGTTFVRVLRDRDTFHPWDRFLFTNSALAAGAVFAGMGMSGNSAYHFQVPAGYDLLIVSAMGTVHTGATDGTYTADVGWYDWGADSPTVLASATGAQSTTIYPKAQGTIETPVGLIPAGKNIGLFLRNNASSPGALAANAHRVQLSGVLRAL